MAAPTGISRTTPQTPRRHTLHLVRPPHVPRPNQELGLRPRIHQPQQRQTARTPRQDQQSRMRTQRDTDPTTRRTTPRRMQHPSRRRWQRTPRGQQPWTSNTHRHIKPSHAMAMVTITEMHCNTMVDITEMHCNTTTYNETQCTKSVAAQPLPSKISKGGWSRTVDERQDFSFPDAIGCVCSKHIVGQQLSGVSVARIMLRRNRFRAS